MNPNQKTLRPRPPDKGSFPLDHEGECKGFMENYLKCLKQNGSDHSHCRKAAQDYLKCRMDKQLMAEEEWGKLGYKNNGGNV